MARWFIGVLCALGLVSSSAAVAPAPLPLAQVSGAAGISLEQALLGGNGARAAGDASTGSLTPAVDPDIRVASPAVESGPVPAPSAATASPAAAEPGEAPLAAPVTAPESVAAGTDPDPQTASIPPLWGPDHETGPAATTQQAAPAAPESATALPSTEALVPDSNASAVLTVFTKINEYRVANGLNKVKYHPTVAGLAQDWSDNIASREVIEHRANFWTD
ncbi:MAG: CAP domain-containing protein, partial [Actinomycetes bacterium]